MSVIIVTDDGHDGDDGGDGQRAGAPSIVATRDRRTKKSGRCGSNTPPSVVATGIEQMLHAARSRPLSAAERTRAVRVAHGIHREVEHALLRIFDPGTEPDQARGQAAHLRRLLRALLGISKSGERGFALAFVVEMAGAEIRMNPSLNAAAALRPALRVLAPVVDDFWRHVRARIHGKETTILESLERGVRLKAKGRSQWLRESHAVAVALGLYSGTAAAFAASYHRFKTKPIGPRNVID